MMTPHPTIPRRFWVKRVVLSLVLGAVTTVAVAWGIALRGAQNAPLGISQHEYTDLAPLRVEELRGFGWSRRWWSINLQAILPWWRHTSQKLRFDGADIDRSSIPESIERWVRSRTSTHGSDDVRGWPWFALSCETPNPWTKPWSRVTGGFVLGMPPAPPGWKLPMREATVIPFRPLWPGFALDSLFYAGAWLILISFTPRARRWRRVRRGRCPACGYDVAGAFDAGCSECGWGREGESPKAEHPTQEKPA